MSHIITLLSRHFWLVPTLPKHSCFPSHLAWSALVPGRRTDGCVDIVGLRSTRRRKTVQPLVMVLLFYLYSHISNNSEENMTCLCRKTLLRNTENTASSVSQNCSVPCLYLTSTGIRIWVQTTTPGLSHITNTSATSSSSPPKVSSVVFQSQQW